MSRIKSSPISPFRSKLVAAIAAILLFIGITANATGNLNNPDSGYLLCVNTKTKMVTHPGFSKCPKGTTALVLGQKGKDGIPGLTGAAGLNGLDGKDGKTLWNGVKDPESTWGAPGDMFINSVTKTLFGPKNLDGTWPIGVSMVGPKGDQGPVGLAGATGLQGPGGGSGPAGPAGATGPTGATGATGAAAPRLFLWDSDGVKQENVEFVGSWLENYYFKISNRIWRLSPYGDVKSFYVYFRDDACTAPAVYVTGGTGWNESNPQPLLNSHFTNSYYVDSNVYRITGPIITLTTIYSYDGTTCTLSGEGSFEVLKAVKLSDLSAPASFGRFTIGP